MKRILILAIFLSPILYGCGEAGFESDISKVTEVSFNVSSNDFTPVGGFLLADLSQQIDPASEDFGEYIDDVENWIVNKLEVQVTGYSSSGNDPTGVFFGMGAGPLGNTLGPNVIQEDSRVSSNTPLLDALTDANGKVANSDRFVIYDRSNEANGLINSNNAGLQELLNALTNKTPFEARVQVATQGGALGSGMMITLFFDLTARVQLD